MCRLRLNVERYHARSISSTMHQVALGGSEVDQLYKGAMNSQYGFCGALQFHGKSIKCCNRREVSVPPLQAIPTTVHTLLTADTEEGHNFHEHICLYNSSLTFASIGANMNILPGYGPYCYCIQCQIYHSSGPLSPDKEQRRQYSQLYILEAYQAVEE